MSATATAAAAVVCPMGEAVEETAGGPGCLCRVTRELLSRETDSRSLQAHCASDYVSCPSWQRFKDAEAADQERLLHREIAPHVPRRFR